MRRCLGRFFLQKALVLQCFLFFTANTFGGEWVEYPLEGETRCARGEPFSFFVHEGRSDKVVVDYIGGGACWNAENCSREGATFIDSIDFLRDLQREGLDGFYNHEDDANPIKDWTHIVVPYCTGDIHWGENDKTYTKENGESFTIYHRGAANAKAVHSWIEENIEEPETLLVTGCSAGAYGSVYWTPYFKKLFPNSFITQFGDSGTGVVTEEFLETSLVNWMPQKNAPRWIPALNPDRVDWQKLTLTDYYREVGLFYPDIKLAQFSYDLDENQLFFHELMGGDSRDWSVRMQNSFNFLESELSNFDSFLASGDRHCIIPYDNIHRDTNQEGKAFKTWFKERTQK